MESDRSIAEAWDAEYRAGRYQSEAPVEFVPDIVRAAGERGLSRGVYIGCGNGRNLIPLWDAGLDLVGVDVSPMAIDQLARRRPDRTAELVVGSIDDLVTEAFELVVGIQVFQHGSGADARAHLVRAARRVAPGGLFCLRVNAAATQLEHAHDVIEREPDEGFTVRYRAGPKSGMVIHFFAEEELRRLLEPELVPVLALRPQSTHRPSPPGGHWTQWEGIWTTNSD